MNGLRIVKGGESECPHEEKGCGHSEQVGGPGAAAMRDAAVTRLVQPCSRLQHLFAGLGLPRCGSRRGASCSCRLLKATNGEERPKCLANARRCIASYEVIKSMIRMIATELLVFWVPSVVSALAHVQTSPFLTVNFFSF